jgi:hypothetical protein
MKKLLRWLASSLPLKRQARLMAWLLPNRYWYRAALAVCRLQGALKGLLGGNRVLTEAVMLDHWLWELTAIGPFPIPYILNGTDVIEGADPKISTLYCWIHEPLMEFPLRPLLERGYPEPIIVADPGRIVDSSRFMVTGTSIRLMAIPAHRYALGRAKRALLDGIPVVCLADAYIDGPLYAYVLQLVGRVGARVVFQWATRRPDNIIEVTFVNAPRPHCENDEAVRENPAFLKAAQQHALQSLGLVDRKLPEDLLKAVKTT